MRKRMTRDRRKRYKYLKEVRRERDYQIGKLQYANRPYTFPSVSRPRGKKKVVTTSKFIPSYEAMKMYR
jgi:hypothetical protein